MSENTEDTYTRLNTILDKVTASLTSISEEREKQNTAFSNLIEDVESRNISITDKFNRLKNTYHKAELSLFSDITVIRQEINSNHLYTTNKTTELEKQIKGLQDSVAILQQKQTETELRINNIQLKKRKWWKLF